MILVARSSGAVPASISAMRSAVRSVISARIARAVRARLGPVAARHPARQRQEGGRVQDRLGALVGAELVEHLRGDLVLDRQGKERAKDDVGGGVAHLLLDLAAGPRPVRATAASPAAHIAGKVSRRRPPSKAGSMMRRWRCHSAPLVRKTERAQKRAQPLAHAVGFREIHRAGLQHLVDQGGLVDRGRSGRRACGTRPSRRGRAARAAPTGCLAGTAACSARATRGRPARAVWGAGRARRSCGEARCGGSRGARSGFARAAVGEAAPSVSGPGGDAEVVVVVGPCPAGCRRR